MQRFFLFHMLTKLRTEKSEMLHHYELLVEMYPSLSMSDYSNELDEMISKGYMQLAVYENDQCIGLSGIWVGSKLWCGKYMELDNIIVAEAYRSKGVGEHIFNEAKTLSNELGCSILALDSYTTNFKAHRFFYNQGFAPKGFHFIQVLDQSKIR